MKRFTIVIFVITWFLPLTLNGQSLNELNSASESHLSVPGTNISLIPPSGFLLSDLFKGFQNPDDPTSMIMLTSIPGPFKEVSGGFSGEGQLPPGMELQSVENLELLGYEAILVQFQQASQGMTFSKVALIFGDSSNTSVVNGVFLADSLALGTEILASIKTTFVDREMTENPRDFLDFDLDESVGNLVFVASMGTGLLLNRDGKTPTESPDKISIVADRSFQDLEVEDMELFCLQRMYKYPDSYTIDIERGINDISISGLDGCSLYASNDADLNEEVYQVILFEEGKGYYLMFGSYLKGDKQAMDDVQKVIMTFRRK